MEWKEFQSYETPRTFDKARFKLYLSQSVCLFARRKRMGQGVQAGYSSANTHIPMAAVVFCGLNIDPRRINEPNMEDGQIVYGATIYSRARSCMCVIHLNKCVWAQLENDGGPQMMYHGARRHKNGAKMQSARRRQFPSKRASIHRLVNLSL